MGLLGSNFSLGGGGGGTTDSVARASAATNATAIQNLQGPSFRAIATTANLPTLPVWQATQVTERRRRFGNILDTQRLYIVYDAAITDAPLILIDGVRDDTFTEHGGIVQYGSVNQRMVRSDPLPALNDILIEVIFS